MRRYLIITISMTFWLVACQSDSTSDPDGLQAIANERLARESLPGRVHYEQQCAACHDGNLKRAPHRDMIGLMTADAILRTLTDGIMQEEAAGLSETERLMVATYLSGAEADEALPQLGSCQSSAPFDAKALANQNWGIQAGNTRTIEAGDAGLDASQLDGLRQRWAVAFPGATRVRSQPTIAGGRVYVGSHSGTVYALEQDSGCVVWRSETAAEVRTGIALAEVDGEWMLFFGDVLGHVYGVRAEDGRQLWRVRADDHPNATITGSPSYHDGRLYVPVSALEVGLAIDPTYECCTFRGSVVALNAIDGAVVWKTYTIAATPAVTGQNAVGTNIIGPSGAVVWNSPSIDPRSDQLFIGTGENMSSPATPTSDAMIAMDLDSGEINWVFQGTTGDVWNGACDTTTPENCPVEKGPDFDFGGATIIVDTDRHGPLVVAGQKSGFVHAVDLKTGQVVWQTRVGRGGIQGGIHFGIAAAGQTLLVPISDMADGRTYPDPDKPGMHALDANTGEMLWSQLHEDECDGRRSCHPGISQVPTVIGDTVIAGAMDGRVRAYDIKTGDVLWSLDTTEAFKTTFGSMTRGGSMGGAAGPVAGGGMLLLSSGYGLYNHMPGNLLLALTLDASD